MENKKNMTDDEKSYWRIYQCDVCGEERSVNYDHICERCDAESADLAETKLDAIRYSQNQHGGVK